MSPCNYDFRLCPGSRDSREHFARDPEDGGHWEASVCGHQPTGQSSEYYYCMCFLTFIASHAVFSWTIDQQLVCHHVGLLDPQKNPNYNIYRWQNCDWWCAQYNCQWLAQIPGKDLRNILNTSYVDNSVIIRYDCVVLIGGENLQWGEDYLHHNCKQIGAKRCWALHLPDSGQRKQWASLKRWRDDCAEWVHHDQSQYWSILHEWSDLLLWFFYFSTSSNDHVSNIQHGICQGEWECQFNMCS